METLSPLQKRVMRRVYAIYVWRHVARPRTLKAFVLALALAGLSSLVSLPHVVANMPGDPVRVANFFAAAFLGTEILVQCITLVVAAALIWFMKDVFTPKYVHA